MPETIDVKTAELSGPALDWLVAEAVGQPKTMLRGKAYALFGSLALPFNDAEKGYAPSVCWHCAGPLMDDHCKGFGLVQGGPSTRWRSFAYSQDTGMQRMCGGETILIAFCRALVALKFGDTAAAPVELIQPLNPA